MKKILYIFLATFLGIYSANAQIIVNPAIQGTLTLNTQNFNTPMNVVYNPVNNVYYTTSGGFASCQMQTFDATGTYLTTTVQNIDYRGAWWNVNTNREECNEYNGSELKSQDVNPANGWALTTWQNLVAESQPDAQCMGAYDKNNNWVVFYLSGTLYEYDRTTGNQVASYTITGLPVGTGNITMYPICATGCPGKDYCIYDYVNRAVYFLNTTGQYTGMSQLPVSAPTPSYYCVSYSNGFFWLCDEGTEIWYNYQVIICDPCAASITAAGPTGLCTGGSVVLNANTGINYNYQWKLNGSNINGATTSSYTATTAGTYTVFESHDTCLGSTSPGIVVTVDNPPPATVTPAGPTTFCDGSNVVLNANVGTYTYQWQQNGTNLSGSTTNSYTAYIGGTYDVVVTNGGCSVTSPTVAVTVNPTPTASISLGGATTFCQGDNVTLTAFQGGGYTFQWQQNGTNITGATNGTYSATQSGTYTLVSSASGCSATSSGVVVTVIPLPVAGITASGPLTFCAGDSVTLSANAPLNGLTLQWLNNGAIISGATQSSYVAYTAGTYAVKETNGNSCTDTSATSLVIVNPLPSPTITRTNLSLSVPAIYTTYQWIKNGTNVPGATHNSYVYSTNGTYIIKVTDGNGCTGYDTLVISNLSVSVTQNGQSLGLYPNPNTGIFTLAGDITTNDREVSIEILDITGRRVFTQTVPVINYTINSQVSLNNGLPPGHYTLKLITGEQNYFLPFIKQ
jgi:hypothetical protein